jgi:tetratricopeptide (TPR) repeat protein
MDKNDLILLALSCFLGAFVAMRLTVAWDAKKFEKRIASLLTEAEYLFANKDFRESILLCEKIFESEIIFDGSYRSYLEKAKLIIGRAYFYVSCEDNDQVKVVKALNALKLADETNSKTRNPESAAYINLYMGLCQWKLSFFKDKKENLEKALNRIEKSSLHISPEHEQYGKLFNNWGTVSRTFAEIENQIANCMKSLEYYFVAEAYFVSKNKLVHLADTQNNIGNTYLMMSQNGDSVENIQLAIRFFKKSLSNISIESCPQMYVVTQINLSSAYSRIPGVAKIKRHQLATARRELLKAMRILSHKDHQDNFITAKVNLAVIQHHLSDYIGLEQRLKLLSESVNYYQEALEKRSIGTHPIEYARIKHNLGNSYYSISKLQETNRFIDLAILSYKEAIEIWTKEKYPLLYAMVIHCLANSYIDLAKNTNEIKSLFVAINLCKHALRIRRAETNPWEHCTTLISIGHAYIMAGEIFREPTFFLIARSELLTALTLSRKNTFLDFMEPIEKNMKMIESQLESIQNE